MLESDGQETADDLDRGRVLAIVAKMIAKMLPDAAAHHAVRVTATIAASPSGQDCPNGIKRPFATPASPTDRHRLVGGPAALCRKRRSSCFLGKSTSDQRERVVSRVRKHRLVGGPAALSRKRRSSCFLGKSTSDQRERVVSRVRQHRLVGGPAALWYDRAMSAEWAECGHQPKGNAVLTPGNGSDHASLDSC